MSPEVEIQEAIRDLNNAIRSLDLVGLRQRSEAWYRITQVLDEIEPGWISGPGTGIECAEATIRKLAENQKES